MAQATKPPEILTAAIGRYTDSLDAPESNRPFVTLAFAQSLDAKLAGKHRTQLLLSGKESMVMTHWMRSMHDAILVGIGTALNDDPQLNTRLLPPSGDRPAHLPRPVILDAELRLPPACKLLRNHQAGRGRRPWVLCAQRGPDAEDAAARRARADALERAGARIVRVPAENDLLSVPAVLAVLRERGVRTLMVEGGARVIASFLAQPVVDSIVVTVAPVFIGADGVGYSADLGEAIGFRHFRTDLLGKDTMLTMTAITTPSVHPGTSE